MKNNWQTKKLGEVCEVVTGTTPPKSDMTNYGNEIPFFKPPHLWDNLIHTTEEKLSLNGAKKARVVPPNTVLVTCIGNLGRTGFVKREAAFNQQINAILENEKLIGKYLFYQAQSPSFRNQLERLATGTTVSIVNKKNFETIEIPVPPLETQHAIVSKIEELFSELDQGIADLKTAQVQLKVYRQSVLKYAFEGDWKVFNIKDVTIDIFAGGDKPKEYSEFKNEKFPFPIYANAVAKKGLFGFTNLARVKEECITIAGRGSGTGHIELRTEPFLPIVRLIVIIPNKKIITSKYLYYYLKNLTIVIEGSAIPQLTIPTVKEYFISVPPLEEQHLIVQEIESRLSVADKMEESIQESLQKAEALKQSILKKAFSGELV